MPPSPSLRRPLQMETRGDNHRRGRSLEYGLSFKTKDRDDDLVLFNEMQNRESDIFLLQSTDDFEDILASKPKPFPDLKLGINIPARGESSDLLNADGDKNDYDWLLTPPETPLFRSLDDEPPPANLAHTGRGQSRPISISRSATMERSHRSRGSPSPRRPQSSSGAFRGRPSSAPHSSSPVSLRPSSPSRKPSPPPVKCSTPTSQRSSTGSGGPRGNSPARASSGNPASPKIRAWQSNIPGLSLETPPPNLRTSLVDRPASYVRGSSPASRTSTNSSSKFGRRSMSPVASRNNIRRSMSPAGSRNIRRSMSPAASRSIGSSHSQERDKLSSHSRGSLASSGDDDADSLQSVPVRVSSEWTTTSRKGVGFPGGKPSAFSKKPVKTSSANSAPKRSFDSAMRQLDRRSPQNMFRPLLSSVPSSSFYGGQGSSVHHGMTSRNSSVTTGSNTEGHDQYMDDVASDCATSPYTGILDEEFAFDKTDVADEPEPHDVLVELHFDEPSKARAFASNYVECDFVEEIDSLSDALVCSRCGSRYDPIELSESENDICPACKEKEVPRNPTSLTISDATPNAEVPLMNISEESNVVDPVLPVSQLLIVTDTENPQSVSDMQEVITVEAKGLDTQPKKTEETPSVHHESHASESVPDSLPDVDECREKPDMQEDITLEAKGSDSQPKKTEETPSVHYESHASESVPDSLPDVDEYREKPDSNINADMPVLFELSSSAKEQLGVEESGSLDNPSPSDAADGLPDDVSNSSKKPDSNMDGAQGTGISVLLLKRSSSARGPLVHSRSLNSSAISYDGLSYTRDLSGSMRSSTGHGSISTISSVDLSSTRHQEILVCRHSGGIRSDTSSKPQSTVSSLSGSSMQVYHGLGLSTDLLEENSEEYSSNNVVGEIPGLPPNHVDQQTVCSVLEDNSGVSVVLDEGHVPREDHGKITSSVPNVEGVAFPESSAAEESSQTTNRVEEIGGQDPVQCSLTAMSEMEMDDSHCSSPRSQIDDFASKENAEDHSTHTHPGQDANDLCPELSASDHADQVAEEETTVTVESPGARRTRSLTLEEATDTILFCSSIVLDMAYKAASIAVEKEKENLEPLEVPRPTITIPERREDFHETSTGPTVKTQKARKRRGETEPKPKPPPLTENDNRSNEPAVRNVGIPDTSTMKSPKLESKCNCTIM